MFDNLPKHNGDLAEDQVAELLEDLGYTVKNMHRNYGIDIELQCGLCIEVKSCQATVGVKKRRIGSFKVNKEDLERSNLLAFLINNDDDSKFIRFINPEVIREYMIRDNRVFGLRNYFTISIRKVLELEAEVIPHCVSLYNGGGL